MADLRPRNIARVTLLATITGINPPHEPGCSGMWPHDRCLGSLNGIDTQRVLSTMDTVATPGVLHNEARTSIRNLAALTVCIGCITQIPRLAGQWFERLVDVGFFNATSFELLIQDMDPAADGNGLRQASSPLTQDATGQIDGTSIGDAPPTTVFELEAPLDNLNLTAPSTPDVGPASATSSSSPPNSPAPLSFSMSSSPSSTITDEILETAAATAPIAHTNQIPTTTSTTDHNQNSDTSTASVPPPTDPRETYMTCPICLDPYTSSEHYRSYCTACENAHHVECASRWAATCVRRRADISCPYCRAVDSLECRSIDMPPFNQDLSRE